MTQARITIAISHNEAADLGKFISKQAAWMREYFCPVIRAIEGTKLSLPEGVADEAARFLSMLYDNDGMPGPTRPAVRHVMERLLRALD